jgi:steroid delta-isomerase-like uncharacterized protein
MATEQTDMEKLITELFEAWSSPEVEPFIALLTDDFVYESPLRVNNGKEEAAAAHKHIFSVVSNLKIEVTSYFFCEDRVCIESIVRGTVKATGKTFSIPCASICAVNGNKIRRMTEYFNALPFQQAAVLPQTSQK